MQYILTEEEYNDLRQKHFDAQELLKHLPDIETLQAVCTHIANNHPVWRGFDGKSDPRAYGCTLTLCKEGIDHYCDQCSVRDICPYPYKEWSK